MQYGLGDAPFISLEQDGVSFKKNDESITLPIRINDFHTDGMLFEYLSSITNTNNAYHYRWEHAKDGNAYIQIYTAYAKNYVTKGKEDGLRADADGITGGTIDKTNSLNLNPDDTDNAGVQGLTEVSLVRNITPESASDGYGNYFMRLHADNGYPTYNPESALNAYGTYKGRAWTRLTRFNSKVPVETVRYVTIAYRAAFTDAVKNNTSLYYGNFGLSVNYATGDSGPETQNCSAFVKMDPDAVGTLDSTGKLTSTPYWHFVVIDLLGASGGRAIPAGTEIQDVYLQSPLNYLTNESNAIMDIAAVGYFSYYGDAEEFGYYAVSSGSAQRYYWSDNRGFDFRQATRSLAYSKEKLYYSDGDEKTRSDQLTDWAAANGKDYVYYYVNNYSFDSVRDRTYNKYGAYQQYTFEKATDGSTIIFDEAAETIDKIGYALFGEYDGWGTMGLLESSLDENGRPVYKQSTVEFVANLMRDRLTKQMEYPTNYYWRRYSFLTGTSVKDNEDGSYTVLFGTDSSGKPIDLGTAFCMLTGATKGGGSLSGDLGTYEKTKAHAGELIGSWKTVAGTIKNGTMTGSKITTWMDAAYFMLHNLYVTDTDKADNNDGYGEYNDTYQYLTMPQADVTLTHTEITKDSEGNEVRTPVTTTDTVYFFDSGYAFDNSDGTSAITLNQEDFCEYASAITYDATTKTIGLNPEADGKAIIYAGSVNNSTNFFPFLPTDDNDSEWGETNNPYWLHSTVWKGATTNDINYTYSAISRNYNGLTYRQRDYHYTMTGNGYFSYEPDLFFQFEGDDDVYLYINGELVLDIGGTHPATTCIMDLDKYVDWAWSVKRGELTYNGKAYNKLSSKDRARVDALALEEGGIYSFDFFYMERHGLGSNLRIATNIEITEDGLDVDKFAYQDGYEVQDNGMVDVDEMIEYGFSITNNSGYKLYELRFNDPVIGLSLDWDKGMTVTNPKLVTDANGGTLDVKDLIITVTGFKEDGTAYDPINVTLADDAALKAFLEELVAAGTMSGDRATDSGQLYNGSGLWKDATITIRGIYYTMTDEQKAVSSFRNYVVAEGDAGESILRGSANHTVYQPGNPAYFQWAGKPIVIESEQLYYDLLNGGVVASAAELPALGNMRLVASNAAGTEVAHAYISNTVGGDVYLQICYPEAGTNMAYVTILDATNPTFRLTVPLTVYVTDVQDSMFVLDYGLDTYLTDNDAIFDYEIGRTAGGNVTGTVMGLLGSGTPDYMLYQEDVIKTSKRGNTENNLELLKGSYSNGVLTDAQYKLESPIVLDHTKPWVLEFRGGKMHATDHGPMLFSENQDGAVSGNAYIYVTTKTLNIGYWDENYTNYTVSAPKMSTGICTYRLYNEPKGNGTNIVYVTIDGGTPTALDADCEWISGRDFTFGYMGSKTHDLNMTLEYLRVYEDGVAQDNEQFPHDSWKFDTSEAVGLVAQDTGKTGNMESNTLKVIQGEINDGVLTSINDDKERVRWEMSRNVVLNHDRAWEVEFKTKLASGAMIMNSQDENATKNSRYIYLTASGQLVCMGYWDTDVGKYVNYAVDVDAVYSDFKITEEYSYLLKNVVNPDGSNMVHLYIKGASDTAFKYVGPLNTMCYGSTISDGVKSNGISGMDFTFHFVGGDGTFGFKTGSTFDYLDVRMDTALRVTHEWVANANSLDSYVETADGNRIIFTKDEDGVVSFTEDASGKVVASDDGEYTFTLLNDRLKFTTEKFMDNRYTTYIAMTIHEKGFVPTPLGEAGVDVGSEVQMYKQVTVLPANVVYYEDSFPTIHYVGEQVDSFTTLSDTTEYIVSGSTEGLTQSPDQDSPYGSDDTYADTSLKVSGNSVHTIAINNDGPLAWFEFTGRGFEIDARTNATDSGKMIVRVYLKSDLTSSGQLVTNADGSLVIPNFAVDFTSTTTRAVGDTITVKRGDITYTGKVVKVNGTTYTVVIADNNAAYNDEVTILDGTTEVTGKLYPYYGNVKKTIPVITQFDQGNTINGSFVGNNDGAETIYQVPIIRYYSETVDPKEYVVVIYGVETNDYSSGTATHVDTYLYLDGIRIYRPLGANASEYDDQNMANFERLRELIVAGQVLVCNSAVNGSVIGTGTTTWTEKYDNKDWEKTYGYQGNAVNSVNDYLLDGPNNEVYVDGTFTSGAIAFYVRAYTTGDYVQYEKDLQIGVRALDAGLYYGSTTTGMKANLSLGVLDREGNLAWTHLASVTSGTEQYYDIPFRQCPTETIVESGTSYVYYRVVIKVEAADAAIPAMVAFSGIKRTSGLVLSSAVLNPATITQDHWITSGTSFTMLSNLNEQFDSVVEVLPNEVPAVGEFEASDNAAILPQRPTLSFEDEVYYNIYYTVDGLDEITTADMGLITFGSALENGTIANAMDVIPGAIYTGSEYVVRTNGISAKNLGEELYFKVYAKLADGSYVYSDLYHYSALTYANNCLSNSTNESLKGLIVAMLNYGAAAQTYFGYDADSLMNAGLTDEQKALVAAYDSSMMDGLAAVDALKAGVFAQNVAGFDAKYPTISLEGAFAINYYFTPAHAVDSNVTFYYWTQDAFDSASVLTADNASGVVVMDSSNGLSYSACVADIAAKDMDKAVYVAAVYESDGVAYSTGVLPYSLGAFCVSHADNAASNLQELAAAAAVYGYYAENYFAD